MSCFVATSTPVLVSVNVSSAFQNHGVPPGCIMRIAEENAMHILGDSLLVLLLPTSLTAS